MTLGSRKNAAFQRKKEDPIKRMAVFFLEGWLPLNLPVPPKEKRKETTAVDTGKKDPLLAMTMRHI